MFLNKNYKFKTIFIFTLFVLCSAFFICDVGAKYSNIPTITKITTTNNTVTLYWKPVKGASKYNVYRKNGANSYRIVGSVSTKTNKYTDKNLTLNKQYTYKIVAVKSTKKYTSTARNVTPISMKTPKLLTLRRYNDNSKEYAQIKWNCEKGKDYYVLRKTGNENYKVIKTVKANSNTYTYTDSSIKGNINYTYSVREVKKIGKILYKYSKYDSKGITTISSKPNLKVDFTNLHASISWNKLKDTSIYKVFRKNSLNGSYKEIANVKSNNKQITYKDIYHDSFKTSKEKSLLCANYFVDASTSDLVYTVRGYTKVDGKESFGNYYRDGDFHLEAPSIVSVNKTDSTNVTIEWSTVKNANKYYLYSGYNDNSGSRHWQKIGTVKQGTSTRLKTSLKVNSSHNYFTVKAVSNKNGKPVYSLYDKGFNISNRKYRQKNILFFGDSITFGSPYKGKYTRDVFSYPWRVQQLTNVKYYNPSIPGSTYTYKNQSNRSRMIQIAECLRTGRNVTENDLTKNGKDGIHSSDMYVYKDNYVNNQINGRTFEDFDVIVMAAGTNDYLDDAKLGKLNSTNIKEFNGAINTIMGYINVASEKRVSKGKSAIKVVFVDLFYSDRTYDYSKKTNRFKTKNNIGLTLTDYQNDIDSLVANYKKNGMKVYQYDNKTVNSVNCPYTTSDNLHMNRFTYTQIGNQFTNYLIKNKII